MSKNFPSDFNSKYWRFFLGGLSGKKGKQSPKYTLTSSSLHHHGILRLSFSLSMSLRLIITCSSFFYLSQTLAIDSLEFDLTIEPKEKKEREKMVSLGLQIRKPEPEGVHHSIDTYKTRVELGGICPGNPLNIENRKTEINVSESPLSNRREIPFISLLFLGGMVNVFEK
jgi:hypothetical protein